MIIDTKNWKEFKIKDVFKISRGKRLIDANRINGEIPYYSASDFNNGLTDKINNPLFVERDALICTIFGRSFYVKGDFTASDSVSILKNKNLNIWNGLFIATIITQNKYKYSYGRQAFENRLSNDIIKLPVDKKENPDWQFMENYIKSLSETIEYNGITNKKNKNNINLFSRKNNWKEFKIKDLFFIKKGERLTTLERNDGETPLLTASSKNNGITSFIDYDLFKEKKKIFENKITIDMFGSVFYQEFKYFSDDNIHTLLFKNKDYEKYYENKYVNLFLVSVLRLLSDKYDYGRQVRLKRLEEETIKLPVDKKENPDWQFMENYIKSLPYSSNL